MANFLTPTADLVQFHPVHQGAFPSPLPVVLSCIVSFAHSPTIRVSSPRVFFFFFLASRKDSRFHSQGPLQQPTKDAAAERASVSNFLSVLFFSSLAAGGGHATDSWRSVMIRSRLLFSFLDGMLLMVSVGR